MTPRCVPACALRLAVITVILLLRVPIASAAGVSVMPTLLRFPVDGPRVQILTVTNTQDVRVAYEVEIVPEPAGVESQDASDLVATPPVMTLAPGEQARLRVGVVRPPSADRERGYRVYLTQLPSSQASTGSTVGVRLRVGVPVFIDAPGMQARPLQWTATRAAGAVRLRVLNPGTRHVRLDAARLRTGSRSVALALPGRYLLPGQSMQVDIHSRDVAPGAASVEMETGDGPVAAPVALD